MLQRFWIIPNLLDGGAPPWPSEAAPRLPALAVLVTLEGVPPVSASDCPLHNFQKYPTLCATFRFLQSWPVMVMSMQHDPSRLG